MAPAMFAGCDGRGIGLRPPVENVSINFCNKETHTQIFLYKPSWRAGSGRSPPAIRLEKYDLRGFCIAVPGFDAARLSRAVLDDEHIYLEKFDILLRPKTNMESPGTFEMPLRTFSGGQIRTVRQQIEAAKVQTCETCRGFERLCVLKYGKVTVCRAGGSSSCGPLRVHRDGMHTLVYCTSVENVCGDDDEYTASPLSSVKALLREHADHEIEMANAGAPQQADFEWWKGARCRSLR